MGKLENLTRLPDDFDGQVRLFPLPSLVLFPRAIQALHLFEPRYCEMLADALQSDRLIAMATLTSPPMQGVGDPLISRNICIGTVISHVEREDEQHVILLEGIKRATITAEMDAGRCYRIAKVDVLDDLYPPSGNSLRGELRAELLHQFEKLIPSTKTLQEGFAELLSGSMELGPITDVISHTLPIPAETKLQLLGEANVDRRARQLIDILAAESVKFEFVEADSTDSPFDQQAGHDHPTRLPFPPPFSVN